MWAEQRYFFDAGLRFACQRCGVCCTGAPGTIYVSREEVDAISRFLGRTAAEAVETFLYPYKSSFSIREKENGDCFFFEAGCAIYPVRPFQCQSFPFWFENVRSRAHWQALSRQCPGIGQGRLFSREEIMELARRTTML